MNHNLNHDANELDAAGYHDNETGRIAEYLADTREQIDKAALKRHAMVQKMITRT